MPNLDFLTSQPDQAEYIRRAAITFFQKCALEQLKEPSVPKLTRGDTMLSLDIWETAKVVHSLASNLELNPTLRSLSLCGLRLSTAAARTLNSAVLQSQSIQKLRLNFMIYKPEILRELLPCFCESTSLISLDLSCNGLGESHAASVCKII